MMYIGFDLGDGESCVAFSSNLSAVKPMPVVVNGRPSFQSAVASYNNRIVIGSHATGNQDATALRVCFKRHFLENSEDVNHTIVRFVKGVLEVLRQQDSLKDILDDPNEVCFIVGCPVGWKEEDRKRYRRLLKEAGMQNVRIAAESRAAFEFAKNSFTGINISQLNDSALVIDIGSSTLDLAYVCDGDEYNVKTYGDTKLGGGLLDELIVLYALSQIAGKDEAARIRALLDSDPSQYSRAMLAAREMKEQYFINEDFYFRTGKQLEKPVKLFGEQGNCTLRLVLSPEIVSQKIISLPHPLLDNQSFETKLQNTLSTFHMRIHDREPQLVILTGGPSRMNFFQEMCRSEFPMASIIVSPEPEFDIARGLVYAATADENAARMLREVRQYVDGNAVEEHVKELLPELFSDLSKGMTDALLPACILPEVRKWKNGDHVTLNDMNAAITSRTETYFKTADGETVINKACTPWTEHLLHKVQEDLDAIAVKHSVSLTKLHGFLNITPDGPGGVKINSPFGNALNFLQAIVTVITAIIMGMVCGGAGMALLGTGIIGIVLGVIIAVVGVLFGRAVLESMIMSLNIPGFMRKALKESAFMNDKKMKEMADKTKSGMMADAQLTEKLTLQISRLIDQNLTDQLASTEEQLVA